MNSWPSVSATGWIIFLLQDVNMQWKPYKTQISHFKIYSHMHWVTYSVSPWHHKHLTARSNVLLWGGKTSSSPTKIQFLITATSDCLGSTSKQLNDKLLLHHYESYLFRKMWPVQCTFVHKKQFYDLARTKVGCPLQVTRQWTRMKMFQASLCSNIRSLDTRRLFIG